MSEKKPKPYKAQITGGIADNSRTRDALNEMDKAIVEDMDVGIAEEDICGHMFKEHKSYVFCQQCGVRWIKEKDLEV